MLRLELLRPPPPLPVQLREVRPPLVGRPAVRVHEPVAAQPPQRDTGLRPRSLPAVDETVQRHPLERREVHAVDRGSASSRAASGHPARVRCTVKPRAEPGRPGRSRGTAVRPPHFAAERATALTSGEGRGPGRQVVRYGEVQAFAIARQALTRLPTIPAPSPASVAIVDRSPHPAAAESGHE